jgi:dipeptide/tripeptide permease
MLVFSVGFFTPGVQGPFLLAARGIDSAAAQGGYISLFALVSALTSASYGLVRKVADERAIAIATGLSLGIGLAGLGAAAQPTLIGIALVLGGIGSGLATPTIVSMLLSRAPDASRPRAIGFCYTAIFLGQFLNPLLLEPVRRLFGVSSVFFLTGAVLVVAGLAAAGRVPHRR